jgi:hypothetical protein
VFALLHLAMGDGRLGEKSRAVVLDYAKTHAIAVNCPLPAAELVELWIDNLSPSLDAVLASVQRLLSDKSTFARLLPYLLKAARSRQDPPVVSEDSMRDLLAEVRAHYRRHVTEWPANFRALR